MSYLTNLSARWKWVHRADQWDAEQQRERTRAARRRMAIQARFEADTIDDLIKTARISARRLLRAVVSRKIVLSPKTTVELIDTTVKLRRLTVGEAAGQHGVEKSARERLTEKLERMMTALQSNEEDSTPQ